MKALLLALSLSLVSASASAAVTCSIYGQDPKEKMTFNQDIFSGTLEAGKSRQILVNINDGSIREIKPDKEGQWVYPRNWVTMPTAYAVTFMSQSSGQHTIAMYRLVAADSQTMSLAIGELSRIGALTLISHNLSASCVTY